MLKKTIGLLITTFLLLGIIGCSYEKSTIKKQEERLSSSDNLPVKPSGNLPEISINPSIPVNEETKVPLQPVPVLYYHSIMREVNNEVRMPPEQFEEQMTYLQNHGYHSISLNQLYESQYHKGTLPPKPFVITFDDGYIDNYETAFPILKRHGFVATIFMVSGYVNGEGFLTWLQLKELSANGWDIADHTANHPNLTKLNELSILSELKNSKEALEKGLGHSVDFFAYPNGDFDDHVVQAVKNTGYLMAFTTLRGWADPKKTDSWHVHRVYCYANMGMKEFTHRIIDPNY